MKSKSLFLIGLLGVLLVGCGSNTPKSDNDLIKEAYKEAVAGDKSYITEIDGKQFIEEIKQNNIPYNEYKNGIFKRVELSTILTGEQCKMDVDKVYGNYGTIFVTCGPMQSMTTYVKKIDGQWKIPVKE